MFIGDIYSCRSATNTTGTKDLDVRHSGVDFKPFCLVHGHGLRMFAFIAFLGGLVFF